MGVLLFLSSQPVKSIRQIIVECLDTPFFVEYIVHIFYLFWLMELKGQDYGTIDRFTFSTVLHKAAISHASP